MSNHSQDVLTSALEKGDWSTLQHALLIGANPYEFNSKGQTPLEVWAELNQKGSLQEGLLTALHHLLSVPPQSSSDVSALEHLTQQQALHMAFALGVYEHTSQHNIPHHCHLSPQPLPHVQCCFAMCREALDRAQDQALIIDGTLYMKEWVRGFLLAEQNLIPQPYGEVLIKTPLQDLPCSWEDHPLLEKMLNLVPEEALTMTPYGALALAQAQEECALVPSSSWGRVVSFKEGFVAESNHSITRFDFFNDREPALKGNMTFARPQMHIRTHLLRLDEALDAKDWPRAQRLVDQGANINALPFNKAADVFLRQEDPQHMQALLQLGWDPFRSIFSMLGPEGPLPLDCVRSLEQFHLLHTHMQHLRPDWVFVPQSDSSKSYFQATQPMPSQMDLRTSMMRRREKENPASSSLLSVFKK